MFKSNIDKPARILLLSIICIFLFGTDTIGQLTQIKQLKNWELKGYGKDAERVRDIYSAIDYYSEYMKRGKDDKAIAYRLAKMYFDVNDFQNSKILFGRLMKDSPKKYPNSIFYYAEILRVESKYDSAIQVFTKFQEIKRKKNTRDILYLLTESKIASCIFAANNNQIKKNLQIIHLDTTINKAHMESAPIIINDSVFIYSSLVADSVPVIKDQSVRPYNKFYKARLRDNHWTGNLGVETPFFNLDTLSSSNGVFSSDRERFYFTLSYKNRRNNLITDIYLSKLENSKWSEPVKLDKNVNMEGYSSTQPSVHDYLANYEIVYFSSNRPEGWGNYDIWYTVFDKTTQRFNKAVNAGGYINTAGSEITPFYVEETKTMYFSSDFYNGYGGFDIFSTNGEFIEWLPPENLGLPINSNYNDIYYKRQTGSDKGFLVSNRDESIDLKNPNCCYDIFAYELPVKPRIIANGYLVNQSDSVRRNYIEEYNTDVSLVNIVANKKVQLWMQSKVSGISVLMESVNSDKDGFYTFSKIEPGKFYVVKVNDKTILQKAIDFETGIILRDTVLQLDSLSIGPIPTKPIVFQNIYFDYGRATLTSDSKKTIDNTIYKILKSNSQIIVEVGAHTDYLGKEDFNQKLSQQRAESVVDYLVEKGIHKTRLKPVGYGESKPLFNALTSEGEDLPEAREKNRRIEFTIIENKDQ